MSLSHTFYNKHWSLWNLGMYLTHVFLANCLGQKLDAIAGAIFIQKFQGQTSEFWCSWRRDIHSKIPRTDVILLKIYLVTALNNTFRWILSRLYTRSYVHTVCLYSTCLGRYKDKGHLTMSHWHLTGKCQYTTINKLYQNYYYY
jgi:hypothetical protein